MKEQILKGEVVKVGRKWLHIVQEGRNAKYPEQMLKNELVNTLKVGDKFEQFVKSDGEKTYTGAWKWTHIPYIKENLEEEKRQANIQKWWSYVQKTYKNENKIYYNGIANLHKLNCTDFDDEIEEMKKNVETENAIYWIRRNAKENRLYSKGLEILKKYNCTDFDEEIAEIKATINAKKELEESKKTTIGFECTGYTSRPKYGNILIKDDKAWKIKHISKQYDGMSFGYWTDDWWACDCIDVSDTVEGMQELRKHDEFMSKRNEIREIEKNELNPVTEELDLIKKTIKETIEKHDILKNGKEKYPFKNEIDEIIFDDLDIYGGGSSIFIKNNQVWYFINNGSDGAMWSINHIETCGAGGYGYIANINYVKELIDKYKNFKIKIKNIENKIKEVENKY